MLEIKMKVKENAKNGETQVKLQENEYGNSTLRLEGEDASLTFEIGNQGNKTVITIIIISIAVVGMLAGVTTGLIITKRKKGEQADDI